MVEAAIGEMGDDYVFWEGHLDLKNCGEKKKKKRLNLGFF